MTKISQSQKVVEFLKAHPNERFSARQIAENIICLYSEDYNEKRCNPRFSNDREFISQIVAEIGAQKDQILKIDPHIFWQDRPRPRIYWYSIDQVNMCSDEISSDKTINRDINDDISKNKDENLTEHDLYPILINYLNSEHELYCLRIDEKRSSNSRGKGGNHWLHPDIVAMQPVDKEWNELIRNCVKFSSGQSVRLWSFEMKKQLTSSNVRESFFQAVSNSSWANEGYLVTASISNSLVEQELRMLSALHGIGVILINTENPSESDMIFPSIPRQEVDWQSVNRILVENEDFKDFIELVSTYYQTGRIRKKDWNKII